MAKNTPCTPEEAEEAAQALRNAWLAGKRSLARVKQLHKKNPVKQREKQNELKIEAKIENYNYDTMSKVWRIAQQYTKSQIEDICALIIRHCARFSLTHLIRLLTVEDRLARDALMREAIEGYFSLRELESASNSLKEHRHVGGRKPAVSDDPVKQQNALEGLCLKWCRWHEEALQNNLPKKLHALMDKATEAVKAVKAALKPRLEKLDASKQQKA